MTEEMCEILEKIEALIQDEFDALEVAITECGREAIPAQLKNARYAFDVAFDCYGGHLLDTGCSDEEIDKMADDLWLKWEKELKRID